MSSHTAEALSRFSVPALAGLAALWVEAVTDTNGKTTMSDQHHLWQAAPPRSDTPRSAAAEKGARLALERHMRMPRSAPDAGS